MFIPLKKREQDKNIKSIKLYLQDIHAIHRGKRQLRRFLQLREQEKHRDATGAERQGGLLSWTSSQRLLGFLWLCLTKCCWWSSERIRHHLRLEVEPREPGASASRLLEKPTSRRGAGRARGSLCCCPPSEVARELALFTAVEGRVVEEGAGGAVPLSALVILLV